jgi:hypothetical protein
VLAELKLVAIPEAYSVLGLCVILDAYLLYQFSVKKKTNRALQPEPIGLVSIPPKVPDPVPGTLDVPRR